MQRLEVSVAVRLIYKSLGVKTVNLKYHVIQAQLIFSKRHTTCLFH